MSTVVVQKRVGKRGTSYAVNYTHPITGKKTYYKTLKKYKDAQNQAHELRSLLDSGKTPENNKMNPLKFSEVSSSLRKEWKTKLIAKELSKKCHDDYNYWLNTLDVEFGSFLLCGITKGQIIEYRNFQVSKNSVVSANKYLKIIKAVFKHGQEIKAVVDDPSSKISLLNEKDHERNRFLFPEELDTLIEASKQIRAKYYLPAIIYLGAEHGASRQEILSLCWSDINFDFNDKGIISFYRTKNKKQRTEYLMPRTKQALLEWKEHQAWMRHRKKIEHNGEGLVFCHLNGQPVKHFSKAFNEACKIAGIENFHFHDLRHCFGSNLLLSGATLKDVKEMIGHSDIKMTDRYSHLSIEHKLFRQEQLAKHYSNNPSLKS